MQKVLIALALVVASPAAHAGSYFHEFATGVTYRLTKGSAACPQSLEIRAYPSSGITLNGARVGEQAQMNGLFNPVDKENPFGAGTSLRGLQELRTEPCDVLGLRCESATTVQISRLFWNESYSKFALTMRYRQTARHNPFYSEQIADAEIMNCRYNRAR